MRNYIDMNYACLEGKIIHLNLANSFARDDEKYEEMVKAEREHLKVCRVCNPVSIEEELFGKPVTVVK